MDKSPTAILQLALENLATISYQLSLNSINLLENLEIADGKIVAVDKLPFDKMKSLIQLAFSEKKREQETLKLNLIKLELKKTIDLIRSYYPVIEKMKTGSENQQKLAQWAAATIQGYNETLRQSLHSTKRVPFLVKKTISETELHKILHFLPQPVFDQEYVHPLDHAAEAPTQQEQDAFRMKAIRLIETNQVSPSLKDAINYLHEFPIAGKFTNHSMINLRQTLCPFPGEYIELKGTFYRNSSLSIALPETFQISANFSRQTGFPMPSQYCGYAFSECLIPFSIHNLDTLPKFQNMCSLKFEASEELSPNGKFIHQARALYRSKREIFNQYKEFFLKIHQELVEKIFEAFKQTPSQEQIETLFSDFRQSKSPYDSLSMFYESINNRYIKPAYQKAWENLIEGKSIQLNQGPEENSDEESIDVSLGRILKKTAQNLIAQQVSENLETPPILLSEFEKKIQLLSLKQQNIFLDEIREQNFFNLKEKMAMNLSEDLNILAGGECNHPVSEIFEEIETYFLEKNKFFSKR